MQIIDEAIKTRGFQAMVEMRDGTRLNTFVFLPGSGGPRWPAPA
jgi:predicted acyl esterase